MKLLLTALSLFFALTASAWQPAAANMLTPWGEKVTPENAWSEYPRPAFTRENWTNLNGLWSYSVTSGEPQTAPTEWAGDILVPFAIESALSGVGRRISPEDVLWYRREFDVTPKPGHRVLLNFEAVDYRSTVWMNDTRVGGHTGGNLPFSFDITAALRPGKNTLTLRVTDATDTFGAYQLHGKQTLKGGSIWYTPVSGIWQTVWLEHVPDAYLAAARITPRINGTVTIELTPGGLANDNTPVRVIARLNGEAVATAEGKGRILQLTIPDPKLWAPASPTLYDLTINYASDVVRTYVGLRETTIVKAADGHLRLALNGKVLFHFGPLDQGWWPDGLLTPPSDAGMRSDLEFLKASGFNGLRKHIKVEPRRYYTHCDRLGLLVWQDQVSNGVGRRREDTESSSPVWTKLAPEPTNATWPDWAHEQYMAELKGMMDLLHNHPAIVQWVTFNEAWGQHRTENVGQWAVAYDPSRQINIASGGNFFRAGHIVDAHNYPHPEFPFDLDQGRFDGFVKVVGEFGGHGYPVEGHLWNPNMRNWGYGGLPKDKDEWLERYKTSLAKLADLKQRGIAAGIYTQTTDVEGEINGLITYDRKVQKLRPDQLKALHREAGLID